MSLEEGKDLVEKGEFTTALDVLSRVYSETRSVDALYYQALTNTRLENNACAAEIFSQVIEIDPKFDTAHAYRGMNLAAMGLLTLAIIDYNVAIRLNTKDSASFFNRAEANAKLGNMELAVADLTKYLERQPADEDAFRLRAKCLRELGKQRKMNAGLSTPSPSCSAQAGTSTAEYVANTSSSGINVQENGIISEGFLLSPGAGAVFSSPLPQSRTTTRASTEIPSALKKRRKSPRSKKKSLKLKVAFGVVKVRKHVRELGGSGGVPERGGISLGLGDFHSDCDPMSIDAFESQRQPVRVLKDEFMPSPARTRRLLLQRAMGDSRYYARHREECRELKMLRRSREDAWIKDHTYHPDYGTLEETVHPTALSNGKSAEFTALYCSSAAKDK